MTKSKNARDRKSVAPVNSTAPVSSGSENLDTDWVRLPTPGCTLCGLKRSYLQQLCAKGTIRSVTIRQPDHKRGIRLIFRPAIHAYLAALDWAQNGAPEGSK